MTRFNAKGMWRIPGGKKKKKGKDAIDEDMVIKQCYCPNGHDLINPKVNVRGYNGILIKIKKGKNEGFVALSPICGDKSKYTIDIEVSEVTDIPAGHIEPPPAFGAHVSTDFTIGMGKLEKKVVILLNIDRALSTEDVALVESQQSMADA